MIYFYVVYTFHQKNLFILKMKFSNELENDIVFFPSKGNIMILGDSNARTSTLKEFIYK